MPFLPFILKILTKKPVHLQKNDKKMQKVKKKGKQ